MPFGRGTYAARSSVIGSAALRYATNAIIEKGARAASEMLEAAVEDIVFEQGIYRVSGTDRAIPLVAVAKSLYRPVHLPNEVGLGLEGSGTYGADIPSFPNGCHVVEVEIDPATGQAAIDRYAVVDDCGIPINPMICEGQIQGGLAQGIGQALLEQVVYDRQSGHSSPAASWTTGCRGPTTWARSRRNSAACRARPIRSASRASANRAPSARHRR